MSETSDIDVSKCPHCGQKLSIMKQAMLKQVVAGPAIDVSTICDSCRRSITAKDVLGSE